MKLRSLLTKHKGPSHLTRNIFLLAIVLVGFGLLMIYNASVVDALRDFGDQYYYFKLQLKWATAGFVLMLILSRFPAQKWATLAVPIWGISLIMLVAVLIPGVGQKYLGARRWINIAGFSVQPAEAAKFSTALYLAAVFSKKPRLAPLITLLVITVGLIMLEPDLGTSIIITTTSIIVYFASGGELKKLFTILASIAFVGLLLVWVSPYRRNRLLTYLNPNNDPQGSSYHIRQALIAFGNGGLWGTGLGQSRQKYQYLPEVTTDSIFAVVGEELGLVGSTALTAGIFWFIYMGFRTAKGAPTPFQKLFAVGLIGWLSSQTIFNLGSIIGLIPLTGVPLPLISYGGSSLLTAFASIGVLLSISRNYEA